MIPGMVRTGNPRDKTMASTKARVRTRYILRLICRAVTMNVNQRERIAELTVVAKAISSKS